MPANGLSVLIGEDEAVIALDIQQQLQALGYGVVVRSGTPDEIVALAKDLKPDVIVLDLNIAGDTQGAGIARDIHAVANIPIVFTVAYKQDFCDAHNQLPTPYRYVVKPFSSRALQAAIQELLVRTE